MAHATKIQLNTVVRPTDIELADDLGPLTPPFGPATEGAPGTDGAPLPAGA